MKVTKDNITKISAGLGAVAGMRASLAPALASHYLNKYPKSALAKSRLSFMQSDGAAMVTKALSAAEFIADKLPGTPNRTILQQTLPRVLTGAFIGAVLFRASKESVGTGMLIGGASALASTYVSFYVRKYLSKIPYLKDPVLGAVEDLVAVKYGASLLKR